MCLSVRGVKGLIYISCEAKQKQEDITYLGVKISLSVTQAYIVNNNLIAAVNWMQS